MCRYALQATQKSIGHILSTWQTCQLCFVSSDHYLNHKCTLLDLDLKPITLKINKCNSYLVITLMKINQNFGLHC